MPLAWVAFAAQPARLWTGSEPRPSASGRPAHARTQAAPGARIGTAHVSKRWNARFTTDSALVTCHLSFVTPTLRIEPPPTPPATPLHRRLNGAPTPFALRAAPPHSRAPKHNHPQFRAATVSERCPAHARVAKSSVTPKLPSPVAIARGVGGEGRADRLQAANRGEPVVGPGFLGVVGGALLLEGRADRLQRVAKSRITPVPATTASERRGAPKVRADALVTCRLFWFPDRRFRRRRRRRRRRDGRRTFCLWSCWPRRACLLIHWVTPTG